MELKEIAKNVMVSCLAVKPTEDVLIITDDSRLTIGTALYEGAKELGCEALPVSYTHLDVYKRQALCIPAEHAGYHTLRQ